MKKSWHVGLHSNQARVWEKEKEALEERKRTAELQKELAQERAVQELQRLQEEAGGKKREERVDWMYAAPAEGSGPNAEELEQYLLGKKRVDKLLKGNEEKVRARCRIAHRAPADSHAPVHSCSPHLPTTPQGLSPPFRTPTRPATRRPRFARIRSWPSSGKSNCSTRRCSRTPSD